MEWALLPFKRYAQFEGRSCRKEYWYFFLLNLAVGLVVGALEGALGLPNLLGALVSLAFLIPGIAVGVRRLHDTNRSGWWLLIGLIPVVGWIVIIVFLAQKGDAGSNRFGSDPLGVDPTTAAEVFS